MAAPIGNQYARKAKIWTAAIERALAKRSRAAQIDALDELAEKLLSLCDQGDLAALQELGNRLEGKPAQSVSLTGDGGGPMVHEVVWRVVRPSDGTTGS